MAYNIAMIGLSTYNLHSIIQLSIVHAVLGMSIQSFVGPWSSQVVFYTAFPHTIGVLQYIFKYGLHMMLGCQMACIARLTDGYALYPNIYLLIVDGLYLPQNCLN